MQFGSFATFWLDFVFFSLPPEVDRDGSSQREDEGEGSQDVEDLISLQTVMFQSFSVSQRSSA